MPVKIGLLRKEGESWRDCAIRYGKKYGMQFEVTEFFDSAIRRGETEEQAAWYACMEWDVADVIKEQ